MNGRMWLYVDTPQHYFIENLCDCRGFLRSIQTILNPEDFLVFSSYESDPDIRAFFERHQLTPDEQTVGERKRLFCHRTDYPQAFAVRWGANPTLLSQLADMLGSGAKCTDLCDHIIAYGSRGALLSFHDAFKSDPLIISGTIPESRVQEFCKLLKVAYRVQDRKQFYDWSN
jgi:hypothetical protein